MARYFTDDKSSDWVRKDEVENDYETYVKYIMVQNIGRTSAFDDLADKVNEYIENSDDSFILEGPIQISEHYLVQTLVNEDQI